MKLHILPQLGDRPLASLKRAHIEAWVHGLPLAVSSARMAYETLSSMLSAAVEEERLPRNPAKGAKVATVDVVPFVPLTVEQVRALTHATAEHIRAAVVLAAGTGLPQGELFGLSVDRIDFMRKELRVDRQLWTPAKGVPFLKAPKSRNSYRTIALSSLAVDSLAAHLAAFDTGEDELVFHIDGRAVSRAMAMTYMRRACKVSGVEETWHDLRHHHASALLSEGVNPAKVAERLGHDLKTLLGTYSHVMPGDDDRVRSIVDATLGGAAEDWLRTKAV